MAEIVEGKIYLYPTRTIIEPYLERNSRIENSLSVWNEVTYSYDFQAFIKDSANNRLIIPNTYTNYELQSMYPNYKIVDERKKCEDYMKANKSIKEIKMNFGCRDEIQEKVMKYLNHSSKLDKYKSMQKYLGLDTGFGKTFCAVKYIVDNKERPIIFVDQESLALQWKDRITKYTDTKPDEIYYISGKPSVDKLMNMSNEEILNIKFFICCYRTLTINIKNTGSSSNISDLFNKIRITLKVFDEAHVEYVSIFKMDMISNLKSLYLSATPKRSDVKEDKVYQNIFKTVKILKMEELVGTKENYHNIAVYKWNSKPNLLEENACSTKYGFSMAKYCSYLENKKYDEFEERIYKILFETILANRKKKKTAILFGTLSLLDKFYDNLIQYCKDQNYKLVINKFTGNTAKEDKLKILDETDIIITTEKSFSKGMDVKNLKVLINTVPFSSDTKLTQVVGRLRQIPGKNVIFVDLNDIGFGAIRNQLYSKTNKVYKKLNKNLFIYDI